MLLQVPVNLKLGNDKSALKWRYWQDKNWYLPNWSILCEAAHLHPLVSFRLHYRRYSSDGAVQDLQAQLFVSVGTDDRENTKGGETQHDKNQKYGRQSDIHGKILLFIHNKFLRYLSNVPAEYIS